MKMNYSLKNNKNTKKTIIYGFVLALFFILINTFFQESFRGFLYFFGEPGWKITENISQNNITKNIFSSKNKIIEENKKLKKELLDIKIELLEKNILERENKELKSFCKRGEKNNQEVLAKIIKRPGIGSNYDILLIDIGVKDGVKKGDYAVVSNSLVIGKISEVFNSTSNVKLFSSPEEKIKTLLTPANIEMEVEGIGGGNFRVDIPKGVEAKKGDSIIMPSLNSQTIGRIEEISKESANPFKTLYFKIPINIFKISWLKIIKTE